MLALLEMFCLHPTPDHFEALPVAVKTILYTESKKFSLHPLTKTIHDLYQRAKSTMGKKLANGWRLSSKNTTSPWKMDILPTSTLLFRGQKTKNVLERKATYFAPEIGNANQYLPVQKPGVLSIYRPKAPLNLFRLDDLDNVNQLLRDTYKTNPVLYEVIRSMFLSKVLQIKITVNPLLKDTLIAKEEPIQFKRLVRYSLIKSDFIFANWLCQQGFHGYASGVMWMYEVGAIKESFPEEVMICDPVAHLSLVADINMNKQKNRFKLDEILETLPPRSV